MTKKLSWFQFQNFEFSLYEFMIEYALTELQFANTNVKTKKSFRHKCDDNMRSTIVLCVYFFKHASSSIVY